MNNLIIASHVTYGMSVHQAEILSEQPRQQPTELEGRVYTYPRRLRIKPAQK